MRILAECKVGFNDEKRKEFLAHHIMCSVCNIAAKKMSETCEEHLGDLQERIVSTEEQSITHFSLIPIQSQSCLAN